MLACLLLTLLALPVLALSLNHSGPNDAGFEIQTAAAEGQHPTSSVVSTTSSTAPATTAPATTAPATTAPATTAQAWTPPPTTAPPSTSPPSTAPPTTAAPAATAPAPGNHQSGLATYYAHNPSGCASTTVPRGTTVTVTASSGASITCTIDDYGPHGPGRIIDLSEQGFSQLASLGTGVISVTVTW